MYTSKIALIGKDELFLKLLQSFLDKQPSAQCLFIAKNKEELVDKMIEINPLPDVLILEMKMKSQESAKIAEWVKINYPKLKCIIISSQYSPAFTGYILQLGANAFLPMEISPEYLLEIIETVISKGSYWQNEQMEILRSQIKAEAPKPVTICNKLSDREKEVLGLLCQQFTSKEIADKLCLSKRTIDGHKENLFAKTGARNLAGLVFYAIDQGLINQNFSSVY